MNLVTRAIEVRFIDKIVPSVVVENRFFFAVKLHCRASEIVPLPREGQGDVLLE